jgi:peptide/nickel transport system permease protein
MLRSYVVKRISIFFITVFVAVTINFIVIHITPQNPVAVLMGRLAARGAMVENGAQLLKFYTERFGLDQPLYVQYLMYLRNLLLHGDLGYSLAYFPAKVSAVVLPAIPWTLGLLFFANLVAAIVGNILGALAVWGRAPRLFTWVTYGFMSLAAIPFYLLALILLYLFAFLWPVLPSSGAFTPGSSRAFDLATSFEFIRHATLPVLSVALGLIGFWALSMRGAMASVMGEDYLTYARVKGLREPTIFFRYGMRNAMLPQVTAFAIDLGRLVSGQVLVELIFSYPGLGLVLYNALRTGDYFVIQGVVLFIIISVALAMLLLDLIYPLLDPRIRTASAI